MESVAPVMSKLEDRISDIRWFAKDLDVDFTCSMHQTKSSGVGFAGRPGNNNNNNNNSQLEKKITDPKNEFPNFVPKVAAGV